MDWFRLIPVVALAGQLAMGADTPGAGKPPVTGAADREAAPASKAALPPVLRPTELPDNVVLTLPGPPAPPARKPDTAPKAPPVQTVAPKPALVTLAASVFKSAPPPDPRLPTVRRAKPVYPADFERESALFCQKQIGRWTEAEARSLIGEPLRHRVAYDDSKVENGRIYAFSDPTGRYKEIELDFTKATGQLRGVFVYPWKMTWQECRRTWGAKVRSTGANKGQTFYSYLDRRLDVLVDPAGKVISLGLY